MRIPTEWKPPRIEDVQKHLGNFTEWTLCGGYSLDLILGRQTRPHGDLDVGVFRSRLLQCLESIGHDRVFLCTVPGAKSLWDGQVVDAGVHDIWIADRSHQYWLLQIMVFDDDADTVMYRRDRRLRWPKTSHSVKIGDVRVLNPLITLLYKANKTNMEEKEVSDIADLIKNAEKIGQWLLGDDHA